MLNVFRIVLLRRDRSRPHKALRRLANVILLCSLVGACGSNEEFVAARQASLEQDFDVDRYPQVRWFGVTTLLIDDGETQVLVDGFFSRPEGSLLSKVKPDARLLAPGFLENYGVRAAKCQTSDVSLEKCAPEHRTGLGLIVPVHAHYDHVLDAPLVAGVTGAPLFGGRSVERIAQATSDYFGDGMGSVRMLDKESSQKLVDEDGLQIGTMRLRLIETPHAHTPASPFVGGETRKGFRFPASKWKLKEGTNYSLWIETGDVRILIVPSAAEIGDEFSSRDIDADIVFVGIGYAGRLSKSDFEQFWKKSVVDVQADTVVLTHWDDMRGMLLFDTTPPPRLTPWRIFRLDKTWERVMSLGATHGTKVIQLPVGQVLNLQ